MNKDDIFELITNHIVEVLPEIENYNFQPSDNLEDLGANSIDRMDILMTLMEDLNLDIPRVELSGAKDLGELTNKLHEKIN